MKKTDKIILTVDIIIGMALLIIGAVIHIDYYSSLIVAMSVGLLSGSIVQFLRYYHNTKPENIESYREKMRKQSIELKDERKIQIRNRAGYITWAVTMISFFMAAFIAALFRVEAWVIGLLLGIAAAQYILATILYKYLCKKM